MLWWSAGFTIATYNHLPLAERTDYTLIGAAAFLAVLFNVTAIAFAISLLTGRVVMIIFAAIISAAMLLIIQRVTLIHLRESKKEQRLKFISLFLLAALVVCTSALTSVPLQLLLFQNEIDKQIEKDYRQSLAVIDEGAARLKADTKGLQQQLNDVGTELDKYRTGIGRRPRVGSEDRFYEELSKRMDRIEKQIRDDNVQMAILSSRIKELNQRSADYKNIIVRLEVLRTVRSQNREIDMVARLVSVLPVIIGLFPVIIIFIRRPGLYDCLDGQENYDLAIRRMREVGINAEKFASIAQGAFAVALDESSLHPSREEVTTR
jgi:hypothetical protein